MLAKFQALQLKTIITKLVKSLGKADTDFKFAVQPIDDTFEPGAMNICLIDNVILVFPPYTDSAESFKNNDEFISYIKNYLNS